MQRLSSFIVVLLLLLGCSSKAQEKIEEDLPDVVSEVPSDNTVPLSFVDFFNHIMKYYQTKDVQGLTTYFHKYKEPFSSTEKESMELIQGLIFILEKKYLSANEILHPLEQSKNKEIKGRTLFYLAEIARIEKNYPSAISYYTSAYKIFPSTEIISSLADTYAQLENWDQAIVYYQKVVDADPTDVQDLFLLGAAYYKKGNLAKTFKVMEQVLKINPKETQAYVYLAEISKKQGNLRNYYYYASRGLLLKKDYKSTILLLEDEDIVYKDSDLVSILISSYVRTKNTEQALKTYEHAILVKPSFLKQVDFKIYYGILSLMPKEGQKAGEQYFRKLAQENPNHFLVVSTYTDIIASKDPLDPQLESLYLQILMIDPADTSARYKLAVFYQEKQKIALSQLEYGILYFYQDQKDLSLEVLLNVESKYPDFKNIQLPLYIGLLYQESGREDLALTYYQKALNLDKNNPIARLSIKKLADKT